MKKVLFKATTLLGFFFAMCLLAPSADARQPIDHEISVAGVHVYIWCANCGYLADTNSLEKCPMCGEEEDLIPVTVKD